jgi:hypothetical protein
LVGVGVAFGGTRSASEANRPHRPFPSPAAEFGEVFLAGLHDLGWAEGANVHVEYRAAGGDDGL